LVVYTDSTTTWQGITYPPHTVQGLAPETAWYALFTNAIQDIEKQVTNILSRLDGQDAKIAAQQQQINQLQQEVNQLMKK